ncbi:MAG: glycosyltransferase family 39 protein [Clostridia bacterium]|nr:glycosyltransferase family 39 protein [Clostridia bacterium]
MITLDAWVQALALTAMLGLAYSRHAAKINAARLPAALGRWSKHWVDRLYWPLFALALATGVLVRVWDFPTFPHGLYHDEAMATAEAISLLRLGTDHLGTPWPLHFEAWLYGQMSVFLSYLMMPFFALMGISKLSIRLPTLIMALLALPVMWDFARRMLGKRFALIVLWLTAICPWQIVQSRWSLDCFMMAHMFLFSVYFLHLGLGRKAFMYLSMVFFGLTMYTYGVALYTIPPFLIFAVVYLLRKQRVRWWEALLSGGIYLAVAAPFLLIMAINYFHWESMRLGPFTLQYFPLSGRSNDILLFAEEPMRQFTYNLRYLLDVLLQNEGDSLYAYFATRTLYTFSVPAIVAGIWLLWRARRAGLAQGEPLSLADRRANDGVSLVFLYFCAMVICGLLTDFTTNQRANAIFYPLLFIIAYALYQVIRRIPSFAPAIALIYGLGFLVFVQGYFGDVSYRERTNDFFRAGYYEALLDVRPMDCDVYYVPQAGSSYTVVWAAHEIDSLQLQDEKPMFDMEGNEMDLYSYRYIFTDFEDFEPDPWECAAYVVGQDFKHLFDPEDFIIKDFGLFASVYPRYWAEDE